MFCSRCAGTGEVFGNGMILQDCPCIGGESINDVKPFKTIDKRSAPYKTAIKEIMDLNPKITRAEAVKLFEETYNKA